MTAITARKQRLRTLENQIRTLAEEITTNGIEIGKRLCEIRDDELWAEEYDSWNQYLKQHAEELVAKSFAQAKFLIRSAEVAKRLPSRIIDNPDLAPAHLTEIGRLAPNVRNANGVEEKDYSQLRKQDVSRVLKVAEQIATERGEEKPSVRDIRKAVDQDLGINRAAKAVESKRERELESQPELHRSLYDYIGTIEGMRDALATVPQDGWKWLRKEHPGLVKRLTKACESLTTLLKEVDG